MVYLARITAQQKVEDKSNEITAIPALLGLLVVKGLNLSHNVYY